MANYRTIEDFGGNAKLYCLWCDKYVPLGDYGTDLIGDQQCGDCLEAEQESERH